MKKNISPKLISLIFSVLVLTAVVGFYTVAYEEPTDMPPGGTFYPPINTGDDTQWKKGSMGLGDYAVNPDLEIPGSIGASVFYDANDVSYYINPNSNSNLYGDLTIGGLFSSSNYPPNSCSNGSAIRVINNDGSVECEAVGGGEDITNVVEVCGMLRKNFVLTEGAKRVFVTSNRYSGNLGGLSGADTTCTNLANTAGLGGTWKAWLSTAEVNAKDRIAPGVYGLVGSEIDVNGKSYMQSVVLGPVGAYNDIFKPINRDEGGNKVESYKYIWTGTTDEGVVDYLHCNGWTTSEASPQGNCGYPDFTDSRWTKYNGISCAYSYGARLYCFEQ